MVQDYNTLSQASQTIANNSVAGSNTASLIGGQFQNQLDSSLITVKITLQPSQANSSNSAPITVLAAQGANTIIRPLFLTTIMNYVSTPYVSANSIGVGVGSLFPITTAIFTTANSVIETKTATTTSLTGAIDCVNAPLVIKTAGADPTGGNSPIDFYITYVVLKTA